MDAKAPPEIILSRVNTSQRIEVLRQSDSWFANRTIKTGAWQIEYRSGAAVCSTEYLEPVNCVSSYSERGGECVPIPVAKKKTSDLTLALGIGIGSVLALCAVLLIYLIFHNPRRAKALFLSFIRTSFIRRYCCWIGPAGDTFMPSFAVARY